MSKRSDAPIIPPKVREALGDEVAVELAGFIDEVAVATTANELGRSEYDAYALLIDEKFKRFERQVQNAINRALLIGLVWVAFLVWFFRG